ncbi:hypothetical protein RGV33_25055 [Pseudomonas sp. Bout1]|uniref:hypothetical protein n=1 Tax=Pseudomonas sp. Bout1 TaxID=3048600 RepID=UPI002AB3C7E4|nr:hypothetical protein [Pseudomonas sp. Bout1]MDY7534908.1 hypothetical protein [Pseudomonas sp. Bout1]MEB0189288.1 hypothetical protein [Pseudomonas sp. Bout1]
MTVSVADKVFLVAGLLDFGGILACIGVALHMAYTRMDLMLEHLKNCSAVMVQAPLKDGGPWGKLLLVGWIAGVVTFPGYYLKHGGASIEDLNSFPAPLRRKLLAIKWAAIVLLAALILLFVLRKSGILK